MRAHSFDVDVRPKLSGDVLDNVPFDDLTPALCLLDPDDDHVVGRTGPRHLGNRLLRLSGGGDLSHASPPLLSIILMAIST